MKRALFFIIGSLLLFTSLAFWSSPSSALSPEEEEKRLREVCEELVCTCGCGNMILETCTCGRATEWKRFLRGRVREGKSKEELLQLMAKKHGEEVLAAPVKEGLNWVLWVVVPYIVPVIGGGALAVLLARWVKKRKGEDEDTASGKEWKKEPEKHSAYEKRLEDELKHFDD